MKLKLSRMLAAAAGLALAAIGTAAQARDVHWSVGIHAAPGVHVGLGNGYPVVAPPVYYAPPPVYYAPRPVYVPQPVYYAPAPVYYGAPVYYDRGHRHHRHRGHGHGHRRHGHRH